MKPQYIQTVVAIAEHGSLRTAARELGRSQPALTQVLRQVEAELGFPVFTRTSQGVELTDMGEQLIVRARSISFEIDRFRDEVEQLRGAQIGAVNVSVSPLAAVRIMPRALTLFRKTHPKIDVRLSSGLYPSALKPLREGRVDYLIGPEPPVELMGGISAEHLLDTPIAVVCSTKSPWLKARSLKEIAGAEWIMIGEPGGPGDIFRKPFLDNGLAAPQATTTSESYFGAISLVEHVGAICTFPTLLLDHVRHIAQIAAIPIKEEIPSLKISLMTRAGHPLTPAADALAMCIRRRVTSM